MIGTLWNFDKTSSNCSNFQLQIRALDHAIRIVWWATGDSFMHNQIWLPAFCSLSSHHFERYNAIFEIFYWFGSWGLVLCQISIRLHLSFNVFILVKFPFPDSKSCSDCENALAVRIIHNATRNQIWLPGFFSFKRHHEIFEMFYQFGRWVSIMY